MGLHAAKMTRAVLPMLWKILAIEALTLVQAADLRGREKVLGGDFKKLYELVRGVSPKLENDRPLNEDIARVTALLQSESAQQECLRPKIESHEN
jgi:histidine ammonia-lyase